jgi:hypothetical protein
MIRDIRGGESRHMLPLEHAMPELVIHLQLAARFRERMPIGLVDADDRTVVKSAVDAKPGGASRKLGKLDLQALDGEVHAVKARIFLELADIGLELPDFSLASASHEEQAERRKQDWCSNASLLMQLHRREALQYQTIFVNFTRP